jgi:hypothetical protein
MKKNILLSALMVVSLPVALWGAGQVAEGQGRAKPAPAAPNFGEITAVDLKTGEIEYAVTVPVVRVVKVEFNPNKPEPPPDKRFAAELSFERRQRKVPLESVKVFDVAGKQLAAVDVRKRLAPGLPVLVAPGLEPIDREYLKVLARDGLWLIDEKTAKDQLIERLIEELGR